MAPTDGKQPGSPSPGKPKKKVRSSLCPGRSGGGRAGPGELSQGREGAWASAGGGGAPRTMTGRSACLATVGVCGLTPAAATGCFVPSALASCVAVWVERASRRASARCRGRATAALVVARGHSLASRRPEQAEVAAAGRGEPWAGLLLSGRGLRASCSAGREGSSLASTHPLRSCLFAIDCVCGRSRIRSSSQPSRSS